MTTQLEATSRYCTPARSAPSALEIPTPSGGLAKPTVDVWTPARPFRFKSTPDLMRAIEIVKKYGFELNGKPSGYDKIRSLFIVVSLELNVRQEWAPRFRELPPFLRAPETKNDENYLVDMQVIDLHWRAYSTVKPKHPIVGLGPHMVSLQNGGLEFPEDG